MKTFRGAYGGLFALVNFVHLACGGSTPEATSPAGVAAGSSSANAASSGPLATLRAGQGKVESFAFEGGANVNMITFEAEKVRVSQSCARPDGSLDCDAMRSLRKGRQVKADPSWGGANPGSMACKKLGFKDTTGKSPRGDEDGFCVYPDGSMASTGAIDMYVIGD
jgi:putative hemolysin